jgi:hypothetical protein
MDFVLIGSNAAVSLALRIQVSLAITDDINLSLEIYCFTLSLK